MIRSSRSDRRRLVEALGIGPLWVRRAGVPVADARAPDPDVATLDGETLQRMVSSGSACGLVGRRPGDLVARDGMHTQWLVIGAPVGHDAVDDPFAGPAGRLLDAMLAAIGLDRDRTVVVAGLVNHASTSRATLERQLALLAPRMILVVGDVASAALFPDASDFDRFRGREHVLAIGGRDVPVVATFHPSRLLDDGGAKAQAWVDLCLARTIHEAMSAAAIA